jgi:uncharacterized 2Fe-2S/4Fe-4S cluster protein (DUF4445 family)
MPSVTFLPGSNVVDVATGTTLIEAARLAGITIGLPCGGKGTCGKCRVQVTQGTVDSKAHGLFSDEERAQGWVVACLATIVDDVTLYIPDEADVSHPTWTDDSLDLADEHVPAIKVLSPLGRRIQLCVAAPRPEDGLSDLDRLCRSLPPSLNGRVPHVPLSVIRKLPEALRERDGLVSLSLAGDDDTLQVVDCVSGHPQGTSLGVAVDLGTTTISVQVLDLESGNVCVTRNGYNAQIACGLDVISRINYAARPERLEDLRLRAVQSINRLIQEALNDGRLQDIICGRISGNTIMTHLLLGIKPEYIRLEPYTPAVLRAAPFKAGELGLAMHPEALVSLSPCVGSYVGGDITAGILLTGLAREHEGLFLLLDIGTNGEIVLGGKDFLMTCACSAGPAFEGGGIDCGMRATIGAIDHVSIDKVSGHATYTVIGEAKPAGICGSGLIDLMAGLLRAGWLDAAGKFERSKACERIHIHGRQAFYTLVTAENTSHGKAILISENDIENLMRAKAAIYAAASLLLEQVGMGFNDLAAFSIAGGFGRYLNLENAVAIGLLPDIPLAKFTYLGNASLAGTRLGLLSREYRDLQTTTTGRMTYIDLSTFPGYMDQYMAALFLPHTDLGRFPSLKNERLK